jgi:predicted RNase H-like HicB family nuclease
MNEQRTYTIILHWSEEQGAYSGQIEDLVGVEGTGSTYEDALASTLEAIRWWQAMITRQASPPPVQPGTSA